MKRAPKIVVEAEEEKEEMKRIKQNSSGETESYRKFIYQKPLKAVDNQNGERTTNGKGRMERSASSQPKERKGGGRWATLITGRERRKYILLDFVTAK